MASVDGSAERFGEIIILLWRIAWIGVLWEEGHFSFGIKSGSEVFRIELEGGITAIICGEFENKDALVDS